MEDVHVGRGRSRRGVERITNLFHYRVELFYSVIDLQAQELDHRFDEVNMGLFLCMTCFDPRNSFVTFDKDKLLCLAEFYPSDFSQVALIELDSQLQNFIVDMCLDETFSTVVGMGGLARKMIPKRKHHVFPLVFLPIKLSLTLPVDTSTVERAFSAMKLIKSILRNQMGDKLLNDLLVVYIERVVFQNVTNEAIMQRFQKREELKRNAMILLY